VWGIVIFPIAFFVNMTDCHDKSNDAIVEKRSGTNVVKNKWCERRTLLRRRA
jgi:hypothetical protein